MILSDPYLRILQDQLVLLHLWGRSILLYLLNLWGRKIPGHRLPRLYR